MRPDSPWMKGYEWIRNAPIDFPLLTVDQIVLSWKERQKISDADKKKVLVDSGDLPHCLLSRYAPMDVRFKYSQYLVNPFRVWF